MIINRALDFCFHYDSFNKHALNKSYLLIDKSIHN